MKTALKVIGIIVAALAGIALCVYLFVLQYPNLKQNPTVGKWYRVSSKEMKTSEGGKYRAFFKRNPSLHSVGSTICLENLCFSRICPYNEATSDV